jgi:hypothetical protein
MPWPLAAGGKEYLIFISPFVEFIILIEKTNHALVKGIVATARRPDV